MQPISNIDEKVIYDRITMTVGLKKRIFFRTLAICRLNRQRKSISQLCDHSEFSHLQRYFVWNAKRNNQNKRKNSDCACAGCALDINTHLAHVHTRIERRNSNMDKRGSRTKSDFHTGGEGIQSIHQSLETFLFHTFQRFHLGFITS